MDYARLQKPQVTICGAGVGGLCLAIGLLQRNVDFILYESAANFCPTGAGLSFGPNSLRAMELLHPELLDRYRWHETKNAYKEKEQNWFEFRHGMAEKENEVVFGFPKGYTGQSSIHRAMLLNELLSLLPTERIIFNKSVDKIDDPCDVKKRPTVYFKDGSSVQTDLIVGCDGIKSRVRDSLVGKEHAARFTGKYCYRGITDMSLLQSKIGDELALNSVLYMGEHGHVLTYPIDNGKAANIVAFHTKSDGCWLDKDTTKLLKAEDMLADYNGWSATVQRILSLVSEPRAWALFDHHPTPRYYGHRAAVLGDAAHASTPHQGGGAGQAIEDALVLSTLLGKLTSPDGVSEALRIYDIIRRPRSEKLVRTSREAGMLYDFEHGTIKDDVDALRADLSTRFDWIWNHNPQEQVEEALRLLHKG
ncbi:hypothetical protein WAI453_007433 [Rhynchosporium graminicola]